MNMAIQPLPRQRIAVIGSGIAGLTAAFRLSTQHEVSVFEANPVIGGHTATIDVSLDGRDYAIDTGFIVFNDWTYPNFIALMNELGVESQPTEMGFSVKDPRSGFEYCGSSFGSLFAQRRNAFNPKFWRMLADIVRFNREAIVDLESGRLDPALTLGEYLAENRYGEYFCQRYLVPMGSAIWSASTQAMLQFPLLFFVRFFRNHGLLSVNQRPQWRVLKGGSRSYLAPLTAPYRERVFTSTPVLNICRHADRVDITTARFGTQTFDAVVIAAHSNQALAMLDDASASESDILGAIPYRDNTVILHTDASVLPQRRRAWASWNYQLHDDPQQPAVLSYDMNILQGIESPHTFCVTLNSSVRNSSTRNSSVRNSEVSTREVNIDPEKVLGRFCYAHPEFTVPGIAAQQRWREINGVNRTWFCGAYWRNGFHEDGVVSGLRVAHALGVCAAPLDCAEARA